MSSIVTPDRVNQIVNNLHHDPFEILGCHPLDQNGKVNSWVIRAYLPKATAAWVVCPEARTEYPMHSLHHPNFFVCTINDPKLANYQLRVKEGDKEKVIYDPYAFRSSQITEFDIHLFAEGNHHRIYEKLGAHFLELEGVSGVYFALWAPNARNVSILGDFNQWDGREHQMRKLDNGIWELFIPELKVGTAYKYEVKNNEGHIYEKSDPYGFQQEVRPKTASIVADLTTYQWHDDDWMEKRRNSDPLSQPISVYEVHLG
jgi:1,4-alpha-glucan branching enzyme